MSGDSGEEPGCQRPNMVDKGKAILIEDPPEREGSLDNKDETSDERRPSSKRVRVDSNPCRRKEVANFASELDVRYHSLDVCPQHRHCSTSHSPSQSQHEGFSNRNKDRNKDFLLVQEANNTIMAAYKEIMRLAQSGKTWVLHSPIMGSLEDFLRKFQSPPPPGKTVEYSIESVVIPTPPELLMSMLMNMDEWAYTFSSIVHCSSSDVPTGVLQQVYLDSEFKDMKMVNAEFCLTTPFVPTRKFRFLRCQIEIIKEVWAIFDLSADYFHNNPPDVCRRRPSGVIIRSRDSFSEVIWIENVEVHECSSQENIYSNLIRSKLEFSAKRWVRTLLDKVNRLNAWLPTNKMAFNSQACYRLLKLTAAMENKYVEMVCGNPDESKWTLLSDNGIKIFKASRLNHAIAKGTSNYMAVTSFRLSKKPCFVVDFLAGLNFDVQLPSVQNQHEPVDVLVRITQDYRHILTLQRRAVSVNAYEKYYEYVIEAVWRNEFCSFVISSVLGSCEISSILFFEAAMDFVRPQGFAIMPDGSGGLESDGSLVTFAVQREIDNSDTDKVIKDMRRLLTRTIEKMEEDIKKQEQEQEAS